jgi:MFS family permease
MGVLSQRSNVLRTLKNRNYLLLFMGQGISAVGTWTQNIAMSWLLFRMTDSAWMLGIIAFLSQIPSFFLAPIAGVWVDRWSKRKVLLVTQLLSLLQAGVLTILTIKGAIASWELLILSFLLGCVNSLDLPARHAITPELIDGQEDKANAIALNSVMYNIARLVGPALAGILIPIIGEAMCFLLNAVSYLFAIITLVYIRPRIGKQDAKQSNFWKGFKEGYYYTFGQLPLRLIISFLAVISLMGMPYTVLLPVYVVQDLHLGADWLGFFMATSGLGSLFGAILLTGRDSFQGLEKLLCVAGLLIGAGLCILFLVKLVYATFFSMFFIGLGLIFAIVGSNTLLQSMADDSLRARVMSFYTMAFMGIGPIGSLVAGAFAQRFGVSVTILVGGIACLLGSLYFLKYLKVFRVQACPIYVNSGNLESMEQCRYR